MKIAVFLKFLNFSEMRVCTPQYTKRTAPPSPLLKIPN